MEGGMKERRKRTENRENKGRDVRVRAAWRAVARLRGLVRRRVAATLTERAAAAAVGCRVAARRARGADILARRRRGG